MTIWQQQELVYSQEPEKWHDPMLLKGMEASVRLFKKNIMNTIAIYADKDTDGMSAGSILAHILQDIGVQPVVYVPERDEGYGIQAKHVDLFYQQQVQLIITVDNGSNAFQAMKLAYELGMDMIITDHHIIQTGERYDFPMINPHQGSYPCENLCGGVVALKFGQVLLQEFGFPENWWKRYLDIAAVATIGDVMPLIGENRWIVKEGLKKLNSNPNVAFSQVIEKNNYVKKGELDEKTLGWTLAPLLASTGRVSSPTLGYNFLMNEDKDNFKEFNDVKECNDRKMKVISEEAIQHIEVNLFNLGYSIVSDFPQGVLGLLANRFAEKFNRPYIVIQRDKNDNYVGSSRSRGGFDLYAWLMSLPELYFEARGGHTGACGFTIYEEFLDDFVSAIKKAELDVLNDIFIYHHLLTLKQIDDALIALVESNKPYGHDYPAPIFRVDKLTVESPRKFGDKFYVTLWEENSSFSFVFPKTYDRKIQVVDVLFELERSNKGDIRGKVVDWRKSE